MVAYVHSGSRIVNYDDVTSCISLQNCMIYSISQMHQDLYIVGMNFNYDGRTKIEPRCTEFQKRCLINFH